MANIQIFVGSIYGAAEQVAELACNKLQSLGHEVTINTYARPADLMRQADEVILLCHSNTGAGELPDALEPIYAHLTQDYPRIAGKRYGVINLADSSYNTFNEAGRLLDAAFADLGAVRVGEPLIIDACSGDNPATLTQDWINTWSTLL